MLDLPEEVDDAIENHQDPEYVVQLVDKQVNHVDNDFKKMFRCSLLIRAIQYDNMTLLKYLLLLGYYPDIQGGTCRDCLPLHMALFQIKNPEVIKVLLDHGSDVHVRASGHVGNGSTLYSAMELPMIQDDVEVMNILLPYYDRCKAYQKEGVVLLACKHNASKCLDYLLNHGYDNKESVNGSDVNGITPLMHAVVKSSVMVSKLLEVGASVLPVNRSKQNVLHVLMSRNVCTKDDFSEIVELILDAGVNVDAVDSGGDTALNLLCLQVGLQRQFRMETTSDLVEHLAAHSSIVLNTVKWLLDRGADVNRGEDRRFIDVITSNLRSALSDLKPRGRLLCGERIISTMTLNNAIYEAGLEHGATSGDTTQQKNTLLEDLIYYLDHRKLNLGTYHKMYKDKWYDSLITEIGKMLVIYYNHGGANLSDQRRFRILCTFDPCLAAVVWQTMDEKQFRQNIALINPSIVRLSASPKHVPGIVLKYTRNPRTLREMTRACIFSKLKAPQCRNVHLLPGPEVLINSVLCSVNESRY